MKSFSTLITVSFLLSLLTPSLAYILQTGDQEYIPGWYRYYWDRDTYRSSGCHRKYYFPSSVAFRQTLKFKSKYDQCRLECTHEEMWMYKSYADCVQQCMKTDDGTGFPLMR